jgi:thioredoxin 1
MSTELSREEVDRLAGPVLLEFGASWCPHCQAIQPVLTRLLQRYPSVRHIKIEDGRGKPLGRSFQVKLWPNLVFLRDGQVIRQLARPSEREISEAFEEMSPA